MIPEKTETVLAEAKARLTELYKDRLSRLVLFGSQARGDATADSDIDLMVVLKGDVSPSQEIARTIDDVAAISLENDVVLSCVFMPEFRYEREESPLLLNVRREGVLL